MPEFVRQDILPAIDKVNTWFTGLISNFSPSIKLQINDLQGQLIQEIQKLAIRVSTQGIGFLTNFTKALPFILITFIFTVLATVLSIIDFPNIKDFMFDHMPKKFGILLRNIKVAIKETVGKYIIAYAKIMSITFIELSIGLTILKIPNSIFIAFIIALFDIMPVLGTGGIMVPWIAFSLIVGDLRLGIGLLILYAVITIIRQFIEPRIVGYQLGLNPLVTLIAIYLGFIWFGVTGMFLIPITTNIIIRLYREGKLNAFINFEELTFDNEEKVIKKRKGFLRKKSK